MLEFLKTLTDPESIIHYGGLGLLLFVVFAETGLLVGFFLPGDSLIFISGLVCATKPDLLGAPFLVVLPLLMLAAILGNVFGYWFGRKAGANLYARKDSLLFRKKHLIMTQAFYDKHGGKTLILGRFLPIIRTFAPILAGVIKVDFKAFMIHNVIGAFAWIGSIASIAYFLGIKFPWIENYLGYIVIALIVITAIPVVMTYFNTRKKSI
ncbi:MAG: alkaline phosphatase [Bacteroidetes bacterium]|jgi:membrane-associated protein|nr:alkaline phosphatase [Bacteroidota bacterium]MDF2452730.1 alkaline phosphatase [Bacteroidota bacterium]